MVAVLDFFFVAVVAVVVVAVPVVGLAAAAVMNCGDGGCDGGE